MKGRIFKSVAVAVLAFASHLAHAGTVTYVYTDPQGTPLAEANASGTITATFDYQPYGSQALGSAKAGPGYTGHVNDPDTGFVYMQARYYDPVVGRFLSVDPVAPKPGVLGGFDRYSYANNNPINHIDPTGMCADHYDNGNCRVFIEKSIASDKEAQGAQKALEGYLNKYDKAVNALSDSKVYTVVGQKNFGVLGKMTGAEIKDKWNNTHFHVDPNGTDYKNGGAGGGTRDYISRLTPNAINGYQSAAPNAAIGISTLVLHELAHETNAGQDALVGNAYQTSGPAFEEREEKVQTIGSSMAGAIGAPFSCGVSEYGCY